MVGGIRVEEGALPRIECFLYTERHNMSEFLKGMKVILVKDAPKIGKVGDVKEVASGYALNFLLPQGIAKVATASSMRQAEEMKQRRLAEVADEKRILSLRANALRDRSVVIRAKAEEGRLFGSVGADEIVAALVADGIEVEPKVLDVPKAFKRTGQYEVTAHFGSGMDVSFEVKIQSA